MADKTKTRATTTDAGMSVATDEYSLTVGADGPIVFHDHYLLEQMVSVPVLERALGYWREIDKTLGDRIVEGVINAGSRGSSDAVIDLAKQPMD